MRFKDDIINWIVSVRSKLAEEGLIPRKVADFLYNIARYKNPWKLGLNEKERQFKKLNIDNFTSEHDYLLYIGCLTLFNDRLINIAKALTEIFNECGVKIGVLGVDEICCGNEVYLLGEKALFEQLVKENIKIFKERDVKRIITVSPHAYNIMKNEYPKYGGNFKVSHYTQILYKIIKDGKIKLSRFGKRVTYHDPCFLGRYNNIYEQPRAILREIPGLKLVEMPRNRENALCCGGGSGNFYFDLLNGSKESPSRVRIKEAYKANAEILVTSCPACICMFEDAVKSEKLEDKIQILDLSEVIKLVLSK